MQPMSAFLTVDLPDVDISWGSHIFVSFSRVVYWLDRADTSRSHLFGCKYLEWKAHIRDAVFPILPIEVLIDKNDLSSKELIGKSICSRCVQPKGYGLRAWTLWSACVDTVFIVEYVQAIETEGSWPWTIWPRVKWLLKSPTNFWRVLTAPVNKMLSKILIACTVSFPIANSANSSGMRATCCKPRDRKKSSLWLCHLAFA